MLSKAVTHYSIIIVVLHERDQVFGHILSEWESSKESFSRGLQDIVTILLLVRSYFSTKAISYPTGGQSKRKFWESGNANDVTCALQCQHTFIFFIALLWAMISFSSRPCLTPCIIVAYCSQSLWQALKLLYASAKTKRVF